MQFWHRMNRQVLSIFIFLVLSFQATAQYEGYLYFDTGMFTDKSRYKPMLAGNVMNPFLSFRADTSLAKWGLVIEKIGFRSHAEGMQEAVYFKQPSPDIKCHFALIVFDKAGHYKHAQGFERNANEYRKQPQIQFVDYAPQKDDVVLVKFISAKKIPPASYFDQKAGYETGAQWIKNPVSLKDEDLGVPTVMAEVVEEMPRADKSVISKKMKTGKPVRFRSDDKLYGYILNDSILIPLEYEELDYKYSDFMLAKRKGLWGALNKKGESVLPFIYKDLRPSKQGTLLAMNASGYGLISSANKVLVPLEFKGVYMQHDSVMIFYKPNKQLVVIVLSEINARVIGSWTYESLEQLGGTNEKIYVAKPQGGKRGIIDLSNRVLLPFEYEKISWTSNNMVCISNEKGLYGLVNFQQQQRVPMLYKSLNATENPNLFRVNDERWKTGIIDSLGKVIIPLNFNFCWVLNHRDYLKCKKNQGHYALFNSKGEQLTSEDFEELEVYPKMPDVVFAQIPGALKWQVLDLKGKPLHQNLLNSYYLHISGFNGEIGGETAIFNTLGKQLTDFVYTNTQGFNNPEHAEQTAQKAGLPAGTILVCRATNREGKFVLIDNQGKEYPLEK